MFSCRECHCKSLKNFTRIERCLPCIFNIILFCYFLFPAKCNQHEAGEFDPEIDLKILFTLFVIILWGALVRTVINALKLTIPYTVVLMISGLLIGFISKIYCDHLFAYTALARMNPKILLFTFLPVLIFESAFSLPIHTFFRSVVQVSK